MDSAANLQTYQLQIIDRQSQEIIPEPHLFFTQAEDRVGAFSITTQVEWHKNDLMTSGVNDRLRGNARRRYCYMNINDIVNVPLREHWI